MLEDLLQSIASGTLPPHEVVIVVDRNPTLFDELAGRHWSQAVRVLASPGSGLAAARNAGWQAAISPLVAFVDDDAVATPAWLEKLIAAKDRHVADVVGGWIEPQWSNGEPLWYTRRLGWVVGCSYEGMPRSPAQVRSVIGCNMLIRRSLLEGLGGFDTSFGRTGRGLAGAEETELCIRANQSGAVVMQIPEASVAQVLPAERGTFAYAIRRAWNEGHSKQQLKTLHGRVVLGTEARYTRALLREAAARFINGMGRRRPRELRRASALVAVLTVTTTSFLWHSLTAGVTTATVTVRGSRTLVPTPVDHDL